MAKAAQMASGKKVFFLYPHQVIRDEVVHDVFSEEYEIYLLEDHQRARSIFRRFSDSIVFINIEEHL